MNKTISQVSLALGLLGGCTTGGPGTPEPTTSANVTESRQDLERLRALQVFDVGQLLLALPGEATSCYGPCPGWEDQIAAEVARQLPRLDRLTRAAEQLRPLADPAAAPDAYELAADLQKLRDLDIVQVGELLVSVPANEPNCYNLPCPGEQEKADLENRTRAAFVKLLADSTDKLGL